MKVGQVLLDPSGAIIKGATVAMKVTTWPAPIGWSGVNVSA